MALDPTVTPPLCQEKKGKDLVDMPIEQTGATGKTAYLNIDLQINMPKSGKGAVPMTAVFAPNPGVLGGEVNVLLWLHGDKSYWQSDGKNGTGFENETIRYYLNKLPLCNLRDFILQTNKNFLLVAPNLNQKTGGREGDVPGGLLQNQGDVEAYLKQALNGAVKYLGAKCGKLGNIVVAAHSGGGKLQRQMAANFGGQVFGRMNELWCLDCTYGKPDSYQQWAEKPHANGRLFVYSQGLPGPKETGDSARKILALAKPGWPLQPNGPGVFSKMAAQVRTVVRDVKDTFRSIAHDPPNVRNLKLTDIDVIIEQDPSNKINPAVTAYKGTAGGHYECIKRYLPLLVEKSRNLG